MCDPLTISATCLGVAANIWDLSNKIKDFVLLVRDARSDMLGLTSELSTLSLSIAMLQDDCTRIPFPESVLGDLAANLGDVLKKCDSTVKQMQKLLNDYMSAKPLSHLRWAIHGRDNMNKLKTNLESCKPAIGFALMVGQIVLLKSIKDDTNAIREDTAIIKEDTSLLPGVKDDTTTIIRLLSDKLHQTEHQNGKQFVMQRYLDEMTSCAESVMDEMEATTDTPKLQPQDELIETSRHIPPPRLPELSLEESQPFQDLHNFLQHESGDLWQLDSNDQSGNKDHLFQTVQATDSFHTEMKQEESVHSLSDVQVATPTSEGPPTDTVTSVLSSGKSLPPVSSQQPINMKDTMAERDEPLPDVERIDSDAANMVATPVLFLSKSSSEPTLRAKSSWKGSSPPEPLLRQASDIPLRSSDPQDSDGSVYHEKSQSTALVEPEQSDKSTQSSNQSLSAAMAVRAQLNEEERIELDLRLSQLLHKPDVSAESLSSDEKAEIIWILGSGAGLGLQTPPTYPFTLVGLDAALVKEIWGAGRLQVVDILLRHGAKADAHPEILQYAIENWLLSIGWLLIVHAAQLWPHHHPETHALLANVKHSRRHSDLVKLFVRAGASLEHRFKTNSLSLEHPVIILGCSICSHNPVARIDLLKLYRCLTGIHESILVRMCMREWESSVHTLLKNAAIPSKEALRRAALLGSVKKVNLILQAALEREIILEKSLAVYCAAVANQPEIIELLIKNGADINYSTSEVYDEEVKHYGSSKLEVFNSPLQLAIAYAQYDATKILLRHGARVPLTGMLDALQLKCGHRDSRGILELLIGSRNFTAEIANTALCRAVGLGYITQIESLLKVADVNASNASDTSICAQAAHDGRTEIVRLILKHRPRKSTTALRMASANGHTEIVLLLVEYGIDVNSKSGSNSTAVHYACTGGHVGVLAVLARAGANLKIKSSRGTPLEIVRKQIRTLRQRGDFGSQRLFNLHECENILTSQRKSLISRIPGF